MLLDNPGSQRLISLRVKREISDQTGQNRSLGRQRATLKREHPKGTDGWREIGDFLKNDTEESAADV